MFLGLVTIMVSEIQRHRAAIKRKELSRPIRLGVDESLISTETTLFDYGCGHGDDVKSLRKQGIKAAGWDPEFQPNEPKVKSDIVNLGFVINVIEEARERVDTLKEAWSLAQDLLIVSARLDIEVKQAPETCYNDGYITKRNTFQKLYTQQELRDWIDAVLDVTSVAAAPGVFYVFKSDERRFSYSASRMRRKSAAPRVRKSDLLFEKHNDLLQELMSFYSLRGRLPSPTEISKEDEIVEVFGSVKRAFSVIRKVTGLQRWENVEKECSLDLLVYLALERFAERPRFAALPQELKLDVKAFYGNYKRACEKADELLFSAGNKGSINKACQSSAWGKLTPNSLYIHISEIGLLPPLLRIYEGCARSYIGSVEDANIVKLSRMKSQVSYLSYPDFDKKPHPELRSSLVVSLRNLRVRYYDYADSENPPILHRKEEFVGDTYPGKTKFQKLTRQEERQGLFDDTAVIGTREKWYALLDEKGLRLAGHRLVKG